MCHSYSQNLDSNLPALQCVTKYITNINIDKQIKPLAIVKCSLVMYEVIAMFTDQYSYQSFPRQVQGWKVLSAKLRKEESFGYYTNLVLNKQAKRFSYARLPSRIRSGKYFMKLKCELGVEDLRVER